MMNYFVLSILLGFVLLDAVVSISRSKSCTMINGKWNCDEMTDLHGTSARSASMARSGPNKPEEFRHVSTGSQRQYNQHTSSHGVEEPEESRPEESQSTGYDSPSDVFQPIVPLMPYIAEPASFDRDQAPPAQTYGDHASSSQTYRDHASSSQTYRDHASSSQTYRDHASHTGHHTPDDSDEVTVTSTSGHGSMPGFFPVVALPLAFAGPGGAFAGAGSYAGAGGSYDGAGGSYAGAGGSYDGAGGSYAGAGRSYDGPGGSYAGPGFAGFGFSPFSAYSIFRRRR